MPDKVTVTGKVGPDVTATSLVINDVTEFRIDTVSEMLFVKGSVGSGVVKIHEFDVGTATTMTVTISGKDWTVVIS